MNQKNLKRLEEINEIIQDLIIDEEIRYLQYKQSPLDYKGKYEIKGISIMIAVKERKKNDYIDIYKFPVVEEESLPAPIFASNGTVIEA